MRGVGWSYQFNYSADVHQTRQYSVYNLTYASVAIDGATGARSSYQVDVFNSTYMTFRSTPAGRYTQLTSQGATLTVSMMCAGSLATCQDSGSTGVEKFAFTGECLDAAVNCGPGAGTSALVYEFSKHERRGGELGWRVGGGRRKRARGVAWFC